jgi:hypothetical protein
MRCRRGAHDDRGSAGGWTVDRNLAIVRFYEPLRGRQTQPDPRVSVVKNGVKIFSRISIGMPGPLSMKAIRQLASTALTATRIRPLPCMQGSLHVTDIAVVDTF